MPESKVRKEAAEKKKLAKRASDAEHKADLQRHVVAPGSRRWVPPTFITLGLLGVSWLVVYYVAGYMIPFMSTLGGWNIGIGMGLMAAAFAVSTLWK
ncbi:MAG: cell division protein CrgA [Propionibacteriaceae bacterium]|nr:cell division protein CrgA [Micropruina sp.]